MLRRSSRKANFEEECLKWVGVGKDSKHLLKLFIDETIGYGIFTQSNISKGDFVCIYEGELISKIEGEQREKQYDVDGKGSFLYFFEHNGKKYCCDATHNNQFGKYINDSSQPNCVMKKIIDLSGRPHLCLQANQHIPAENEIRYNYGVAGLWWRKQKKYNIPMKMENIRQESRNKDCREKSFVSTESTEVMFKNILKSEVKAEENSIQDSSAEKTEQTILDVTCAVRKECLQDTSHIEKEETNTCTESTKVISKNIFELSSETNIEDSLNEEKVTEPITVSNNVATVDLANKCNEISGRKIEEMEMISDVAMSDNSEEDLNHNEDSVQSPAIPIPVQPKPKKEMKNKKKAKFIVALSDSSESSDLNIFSSQAPTIPIGVSFEDSGPTHKTDLSSLLPHSFEKKSVQRSLKIIDLKENSECSCSEDEAKCILPEIIKIFPNNNESSDLCDDHGDGDALPTLVFPPSDEVPIISDVTETVVPNQVDKMGTYNIDFNIVIGKKTSTQQTLIEDVKYTLSSIIDRICDAHLLDLNESDISSVSSLDSLDSFGSNASTIPIGFSASDSPTFHKYEAINLVRESLKEKRNLFASTPERVESSDTDPKKEYSPNKEISKACDEEAETARGKESEIIVLEGVEEVSVVNDSGLFLDPDMSVVDSDECSIKSGDLLYETEKDSPKTCRKKKKVPPKRRCFICHGNYARLTRHLTKVHKEHKDIKLALSQPKQEKNRLFKSFKREGINQVNMLEVNKECPSYARERSIRKCQELVKCSSCSGFFAKSFYSRHRQECQKDGTLIHIPIPVEEIAETRINCKVKFQTDVLNNMRDDDIGRIVKKDPIILMIGSRLYDRVKRRLNKKMEVINNVRTDMRRLANLYLRFKEKDPKVIDNGNSSDMFFCQNFSCFEDSIEDYTDSNSDIQKAGLKCQLYYLLLRSVNKLVGHYMVIKSELKKVVEDFIILLKHRKDDIFGDATYDLNERRNIKLKKPTSLPLETDINVIRNYILATLKKYVEDLFLKWDSHTFKELRDAVCTRLTLYNGRRGGEPARLLLREWNEALQKDWLDKQQEHVEDGTLITYQNGKGINHLVPVFIPKDTVESMKLLTDIQIRQEVGISCNNLYVFASTQNSDKHFPGWHSLSNVCDKLPVKEKSRLTGTTNRHRISTIMATFNLSEIEKDLIYKHFGHSKDMNEKVYQAPAAHLQLATTGKYLQNIDKGSIPKFVTEKEKGLKRKVNGAFSKEDIKKKYSFRSKPEAAKKTTESTDSSEDDDDDDDDDDSSFSVNKETSDSDSDDEHYSRIITSKLKMKSTETLPSGRKYFRWENYENRFKEIFGSYINGDRCHVMPPLNLYDVILKDVPCDKNAVRSKINNEKMKWKLLQEKRKKELNL